MINEYSKQSLRQLMSLMLFCSAVFLTACGGAGEAEEDTSSVETSTYIESTERTAESVQEEETTVVLSRDDSELDGTTARSNTELNTDSQIDLASDTTDTSTVEVTSDTTLSAQNVGDFAVLTNSVDSEDSSSTDETSSTQSTDNSDTNVVVATFTASIQWNAPAQRENGDSLDLYEIAGYEVQYRKVGAAAYTVVRVDEDGSGAQSLDIEISSDSDYELLIASYDIDGLYSDYYETRIEDVANSVNGG